MIYLHYNNGTILFIHKFSGSYLATTVFIGNLAATYGVGHRVG